MKKLMYIFFLMMMAANVVAQETYVIDSVCFEENRNYYIEGWEGSTFEWIITNEETYDTVHHETNTTFADGAVFASEINYNWNSPGTFLITAIQTSEHGCDTIEAGMVKVFPPPVADAGRDKTVCSSDTVSLYDAHAEYFTRVEWTTDGSGVIIGDTLINPKYVPGEEDVYRGNIDLIITVYGLAANGTCEPAKDTITIELSIPEIDFFPTHLLCYHDNSGSIVPLITSGNLPIRYEWTGPDGFVSSEENITGLAAGKYILRIIDNIGCEAKDSVLLTEPDSLVAEIDRIENVTCFGGNNGMARATLSGGTPSYIYSWNTNPVQLGPSIYDLTAGSYTVTIIDGNSCKAQNTVTITEPEPLALTADSVDAKCMGQSLGSVDLSVTGGTPYRVGDPYRYQWSDENTIIASTEDITGLIGDMLYTVVVTDSLGCMDTLSIYVNEEQDFRVYYDIDSILCYGGSGSIVLNVIPDVATYNFLWGSGETTNFLNNIPAGSYPVTVTDMNGCKFDTTFILTEPDELVADINASETGVCEENNIYLNVSPTGGTGDYIHEWTGSGTLYLDASNIANPVFYGTDPGTFELIYTVTDENNCTVTDTVELEIWPVTLETVTAYICPGDTLLWNGNKYSETGTYEYVTTNMYGCDSIVTLDLTVYDDFSITATRTDAGPNNEPIGSISLEITGGSGLFTFLWSNGATTKDLTDLVSGLYEVTVSDEYGCSKTLEINVVSESGNIELNCPPQIALASCSEIESSRFGSYSDFIAAGGNASSTCGIDTATFMRVGDDIYLSDAVFCIKIQRTYSIKDSCGNTVECDFTIVIDDRTPPEMVSPKPLTITATSAPAHFANYNAYLNAGGYATDECEINESSFGVVSETTDGNENPEKITRRYEIADACGNITRADHIIYLYTNSNFYLSCPPDTLVSCPDDVPPAFTTYADFVAGGGNVEIIGANLNEDSFTWEGDVSDNKSCPETITRTYSITDENENTVYCEQTITVNDLVDPVLTMNNIRNIQCKDDIPKPYTNSAADIQRFWKDGNSASDNCELDWSTFRLVSQSPSEVCGPPIVRYYAISDFCGNETTARQLIIVKDDTPPTVYGKIQDLIVSCEIPERYKTKIEFEKDNGTGRIKENCNNGFYTIKFISEDTLEFDCPTILMRTYEIADICLNARLIEQKIIVNDTEAPTIKCPDDVLLDASLYDLERLTGLAFNETVSFIPLADTTKLSIHTSDNCQVSEIAYRDSVNPGCPALVTRTFTVYDKCGNYSSCKQLIGITQGLIVAETHQNIGPSKLPVGWIELTVVDGVAPYTYSWTGPDGFTSDKEDIYNLYAGEYTVVVTDITGCETTLVITLTSEDVLTAITCPPAIEVKCMDEIAIHPQYQSYAQFEAAGGSASTNCAGGINTASFNLISQDTIDDGIFCLTIERTYTISDFCGNEVTCKELIIVHDPELPVIICPRDSMAECVSDLNFSINTIDEFIAAGGIISDNCAIDSSSFTIDKVFNTLVNGTEILTTYSITDLCGNTSSCVHRVVSTDDEPPVANCTDITVYLDEIGKYLLSDEDMGRITAGSSDNCTAPEDLIIHIDITEFDCDDIAEAGVRVNVLITDEAGNETECTANVTVLDTIPPAAVCKDITVYLDENGEVGITTEMIDNGSGDNCSLNSMTLSKYLFNCDNVGDNTVVLTVVDNFGKTDYCESTVTVFDTIPPLVECVPPFEIQLDENAYYGLTVDMIHADSYDECGIEKLYLNIYDLNCDYIGKTPVRLTAVDVNGNSSYCETMITVYGNIPPEALNDSAVTIVNVPVEVDVVANDYDTKTSINISSLGIEVHPLHGLIEVNKLNGTLLYSPEPGFVGTDTLIYTICDDAIPCVAMCDSAFVFLKVLDLNNPPVAIDDYYTANCGPLTGNVLDNGDYDPDGNNIQVSKTPAKLPIHGVVFLEGDGTFTYLPDEGFNGTDSFMYVICDDGLPSMCDTATVYIEKFPDHDCDGISDADDIDDDDDGILDVVEDPTLGFNPPDSDQDGIPDYLDIDSDNDGIVDNIEGQGEGEGEYILPIGIDANGNGWDDAYDPEMGGFEFTPVDTDNDGMPDYVDIDAENDHVFDFIEGHDINADGIPDVTRVFLDSDNDGLDDIYDTVNGWTGSMDTRNALGSNAPLQDFDGDGIRDWRDTNDEDDEFLTKDEDTNNDGDYSNDDLDLDGYPEYLDKTLDCELFIPEGFSPNDDGVHDFFQILCIQKYPNAHLMIFNRNGDKLFDKKHYGNLDVWGTDENAWWWGTSENRLTIGRSGGLPAGNYVYVIELGNGEVKNGTVMIAY